MISISDSGHPEDASTARPPRRLHGGLRVTDLDSKARRYSGSTLPPTEPGGCCIPPARPRDRRRSSVMARPRPGPGPPSTTLTFWRFGQWLLTVPHSSPNPGPPVSGRARLLRSSERNCGPPSAVGNSMKQRNKAPDTTATVTVEVDGLAGAESTT
jgi:hypothetical protein